LLPRQDKYGILHLPTPVAELQYIFADFEKKKNQSGYMTGFLQRIKALEEYIQCEYTEDQLNVQYQRIADLYAQDAWIMSLLQIYKIDPHTFKNSIANAPAEMELTYRHLREIKKEAIMFREAYEQFQKMPTVEDMQAFRKKLALSIELVNDIIHSLGFFNRLCGKMQYWIALKDSITHCKTIDVLNELLQGMKDKSKHQALIDSPKYEELQIRTEHCHCHECKSFSF
jgi:hypothetical protein